MGAIVSDFPQLPADADPRRAQLYQGVYDDLTAIGVPLPGIAANLITRAQLLAHLQAQAGAILKTELAGDPDQVGYAGAVDDAALANLLVTQYEPAARRFPGSSLTGYQVAAGSTNVGIVLVTNPGLGAPNLTALPPLPGSAQLRFRIAGVSSPQLRRVRMDILAVPLANTLTLTAPLPVVPTVGDLCDLLGSTLPQLPGRLSQVLRRFPYLPNLLTAADITAAKV